MTVQELIDDLMKIENKNLPVYILVSPYVWVISSCADEYPYSTVAEPHETFVGIE